MMQDVRNRADSEIERNGKLRREDVGDEIKKGRWRREMEEGEDEGDGGTCRRREMEEDGEE